MRICILLCSHVNRLRKVLILKGVTCISAEKMLRAFWIFMMGSRRLQKSKIAFLTKKTNFDCIAYDLFLCNPFVILDFEQQLSLPHPWTDLFVLGVPNYGVVKKNPNPFFFSTHGAYSSIFFPPILKCKLNCIRETGTGNQYCLDVCTNHPSVPGQGSSNWATITFISNAKKQQIWFPLSSNMLRENHLRSFEFLNSGMLWNGDPLQLPRLGMFASTYHNLWMKIYQPEPATSIVGYSSTARCSSSCKAHVFTPRSQIRAEGNECEITLWFSDFPWWVSAVYCSDNDSCWLMMLIMDESNNTAFTDFLTGWGRSICWLCDVGSIWQRFCQNTSWWWPLHLEGIRGKCAGIDEKWCEIHGEMQNRWQVHRE